MRSPLANHITSQPARSAVPLLISAKAVTVYAANKLLLDRIDLDVAPGDIVSIMGPNGAGKTTLIEVLLGIRQAQSGRVQRAAQLRIGYMPQSLALDSVLPLDVGRFVTLGTNASKQEALSALETTGVAHILHTQMTDLSGGELQRVLLARALLRKPQLLVLDEPASGLDVAGQAEFYQLIQKIRDDTGCGVLMVSHDLHLVMASTDHVFCINGHICCSGKPDSVAQDPEFIRLFGPQAAGIIAPYSHAHDHEHTVSGDITPTPDSHSHNG